MLSSARILAQRSAVPAVNSRQTSTLKRKKLTHEEKDKLLRVAKRMRRGPFNAVMDPTEFGSGSALLELSEAAKASGRYNVWEEEVQEEVVEEDEFVPKKSAVKVSTDCGSLLCYAHRTPCLIETLCPAPEGTHRRPRSTLTA